MTRLTFGLVPSAREGKAEAFEALAKWLLENAGLELVARKGANYYEMGLDLRAGDSDVAWLPPVVYGWMAEAVTPIGSFVRGGSTAYTAALVVREGSSFEKIADLAKKRAGWVDPWSAAGYVVPRIGLSGAGIDPERFFSEEKFHGSHRAVLEALAKEACDVVGTYARIPAGDAAVTEGAWSEIDDLKVRVLQTFGEIPGDVIATRRNLAPRDHEAAAAALAKASQDEEAKKLLRAVFDSDELKSGLEPGHEKLRLDYERAVASGVFDTATAPSSRQ